MIQKLRRKLVCVIMAIVTLLLCLIFCTVYQAARLSLEREIVNQMQLAASDAGRTHLPCLILQLGPDGQVMQVTDHEGALTARVPGAEERLEDVLWTLEPAELQAIADAVRADGRESGILEEAGLRFYRVDLRGMGLRLAIVDAGMELTILQHLREGCLILGLASFLAFLVLSLLLARWMVRPVKQAWKQQRQFVAGASHELKTPLIVILTNAELLHDPAYSEAERRRFSDSILTMSRQMRGLTEHLLDLARVDNGIPKSGWTAVNWSKTVSDQALILEPLCFEQGLTLETQVEEGLTVLGSAAHLAQIPEILLDNARKYSSPGGEIVLRLERSGKRHCLLSVSNPGPALSPEVRRHLFERFYRADPARIRDGSYGLGLAIAQTVVSSHQGRIWVTSEEGRNIFWVRLPLAAGRR